MRALGLGGGAIGSGLLWSGCSPEAASLQLPTSPSSGRLSPLWPSATTHKSLNVVRGYERMATEAPFVASHFDFALSSSEWPDLSRYSPHLRVTRYRLMQSIIQGGADQTDLEAYCNANGHNVEDSYLHYDDDSVVTRDSHTFNVPGWGGGTAASRSQARVPTWAWTSARWLLNYAAPGVKGWMVARAMADMAETTADGVTRRYHGHMIDELGPLYGGAFATQLPATTSGGHITEYGKLTRETLVASANNPFQLDLQNLFTYVRDQVKLTYPEFVIYPNVGNWLGYSEVALATAASGVLTEQWDMEGIGPKSETTYYDYATAVAAAGRFLIWQEATDRDYDPSTRGGVWATYTAGNYPAKTGPQGRHAMWALSNYWIARQGPFTWFEQYCPYDALLSERWYRAQERDLGRDLAEQYSVWNTGTDAAGQKYLIHKREYAKALVLSRSRYDWSTANNADLGAQSPLTDLGGTYHVLYADGTTGPALTRIGLSLWEAVTLVR